MFSRLRVQLTVLYLGVAALLVFVLSAATYGLVNFYFQSATDQAMLRKMAQEFRDLGLALPSELSAAEAVSGPLGQTLLLPARPTVIVEDNRHGDEESHAPSSPPPSHHAPEDDVELAAIARVFLDDAGNSVLTDSTTIVPTAYQPALAIARAQGRDQRTISLPTGDRQRVLTYWLGSAGTAARPAFVQVTRRLGDQDLLLNRLLIGLVSLSFLSIAVLGVLSWWLANRSIVPAQNAWEQQRQFVANASHELRTPLTLLRANAETLQQNLGDAAQSSHPPANIEDSQELVQNVLDACTHTDQLVSDLLLLSRLDAGHMAFETAKIEATALLTDIERHVRPLAASQNVSLIVGPTPGHLHADLLRVRQVLLILIDNALRHTPPGGSITLSSEQHGHNLHVIVRDTGSGIAPEHLARVFDRFYQADPAHSNKANAGLGLAIARGLIEGMRGTIGIESEPGAGTKVTIALPMRLRIPAG